jgi:hypothetical protein
MRTNLIRDIKEIFGSSLYLDEFIGEVLPSPNKLRGKIIIMATKEKWGSLVNILNKKPFKNLKSFRETKCNDVTYMSEHQFEKLKRLSFKERAANWFHRFGYGTENQPKLMEFQKIITQNRLVRVYPGAGAGAERQLSVVAMLLGELSGSFCPVAAINAGVQFIALNKRQSINRINQQINDEQLEISKSIFREKETGYAKKPKMLQTGGQPSAIKIYITMTDSENLEENHFLSVKVIDGMGELETKKLKYYDQTKVLNVKAPESTFLVLQFQRKEFGFRTTLSNYAIPASDFSTGDLYVDLENNTRIKLKVEVKIVKRRHLRSF